MPKPYESLVCDLQRQGLYVSGLESMGDWNRITICSKRRPGGGFAGNSFWLTFLSDDFYLGTWGGMIYRLPEGSRMVELCLDWLSRESQQTKADFDAALKAKYDLIEIADEEFDSLAGETLNPE